MILTDHHFAISSSADIRNICKPLKLLDIHFFNYIQIFNDGSQINLSTHPEWIQHFFGEELYVPAMKYQRHPDSYRSGYVFRDIVAPPDIIKWANAFQLGCGITLINKIKEGCEFYFFGINKESSAGISFYLANMDLLQRFILYFKEKAVGLITSAEENVENRIIIPDNYHPSKEKPFSIISFSKPALDQEDMFRQTFLRNTKLGRLKLKMNDSKEVILRGRELDCIAYLLQNRTNRETADALFISVRTVEWYLDNLKSKLECHSKKELKQKLKQYFNFLVD